ncbi:hypothetical protein [Amycolatopsis alkalitolerans]|uniref:Uncharacterized protein n=1 Tax=Amycolatopsis alkalitolerans TaxID=2547244 RepID=A0A5C4LZY2_9PSEU|nr:hypothetical protein [Amycolatopsis alkalitolerans]TNC23716.1 hypothetical protein FG385_20340 [Amycolatopsis alkalitolerans]
MNTRPETYDQLLTEASGLHDLIEAAMGNVMDLGRTVRGMNTSGGDEEFTGGLCGILDEHLRKSVDESLYHLYHSERIVKEYEEGLELAKTHFDNKIPAE